MIKELVVAICFIVLAIICWNIRKKYWAEQLMILISLAGIIGGIIGTIISQ